MIYFFSTPGHTVVATEANRALQAQDIEKLCWLYGEAALIEGEQVEGFFVGPRREMILPGVLMLLRLLKIWASTAFFV